MLGGRKPRSTASSVLIFALLLAIAGKVSAFFKDVALSYYFGVGMETDAYFIANLIPGLIWSAALTSIAAVFLPLYQSQRQRSVLLAARVAQEATQIYAVIAVSLSCLCVLLANPIVYLTAPEAAKSTLELASQLTMIMAAGFLFTGYVGLQNAIQQANGQFLPPLVAPAVNNLISVLAIALAAIVGSIHLAVVGAVLGWVLQAPLQRWATLRYHPPQWRWRVQPKTLQRLSAMSAPVMVGVLIDQVNVYVGIAVAGRVGAGAISHLNYAARLSMFLATVFSWLVAYFLFPRLAALAARGNDAEVGRTLSIGLFLIAALTSPVLIIAICLNESFVGVVFGRGAFSKADVTATASVFGLYAAGVLFIAMREMLNRVFFSYQRTSPPVLIGFIALVTNAVASVVLGRVLGVTGIALAASLSALVYALLQIGWLALWKPALLSFEVIKLFGAVGASASACLAVTLWLDSALKSLSDFARLLAIGCAAGLTYMAVLILLLGVMNIRLRNFSSFLTRN